MERSGVPFLLSVSLAAVLAYLPQAARAAPAGPTGVAAPTVTVPLHDFPAPDMTVEGFPIWLGADGKLDRVVVLVEGFDLFNRMHARDLLRMVSPVADRLG